MPTWIETVLRTFFVIVIVFAIARLLGKRQLAQFTYFEYVTGIILGVVAAMIVWNVEAKWVQGIVVLFIWTAVALSVQILSMKSKTIRDWTEGKGIVIIKDGKVLEDNLKKTRFSTDELLSQLRKKNTFSTADVQFALMESSGELSVLLKNESQPLTPKKLGIKAANEQEPQTVIMDSNVMDEPLATMGYSRQWLSTELEKIGIAQENVFLGQVNAYGELTVDLYDDKLKVTEPQSRKLLRAVLKKCEADLEVFCLSTKDSEASDMYERCIQQLRQVISDTEPYLSR